MGQHSTEFAMPAIAPASKEGQGMEFIFPPPKSNGVNRDPMQWFLLCLVTLLAVMLVWTCWDFYQSWRVYSSTMLVAMFGLFGFCVAAMGVAGGAMVRSRNTASESAQ